MVSALTLFGIPSMLVNRSFQAVRDKLALNLFHKFSPGRCRFIGRVEKSDIMHDPVFVHARAPFFALFVKVNAHIAGRVVSLHRLVGRLLGIVGLAQITDAIVRAITVHMIQFVCRPPTMKMNPRQTMPRIGNSTQDLNVYVSGGAYRSGRLSRVSGVPSIWTIFSQFPRKDAGGGVIIQNTANEIYRNVRSDPDNHFLPPSPNRGKHIMATTRLQTVVKEC